MYDTCAHAHKLKHAWSKCQNTLVRTGAAPTCEPVYGAESIAHVVSPKVANSQTYLFKSKPKKLLAWSSLQTQNFSCRHVPSMLLTAPRATFHPGPQNGRCASRRSQDQPSKINAFFFKRASLRYKQQRCKEVFPALPCYQRCSENRPVAFLDY